MQPICCRRDETSAATTGIGPAGRPDKGRTTLRRVCGPFSQITALWSGDSIDQHDVWFNEVVKPHRQLRNLLTKLLDDGGV
jgi:hypothetical protein